MNTLQKYAELANDFADATNKLQRARGSLDQVMKQLLAEFGVRSLKEAKQLQRKMLREENEIKNWIEAKLLILRKKIHCHTTKEELE